jgi:hypothetical protein
VGLVVSFFGCGVLLVLVIVKPIDRSLNFCWSRSTLKGELFECVDDGLVCVCDFLCDFISLGLFG